MKKETMQKLSQFNLSLDERLMLSERYKVFEEYLRQTISGEGMIGNNNYLLLWEKSELEELNTDYETQEFLSNIMLIGSGGGDTVQGIDIDGRFIEVPYIGMDDGEVKIIADDFDSFINYVQNKSQTVSITERSRILKIFIRSLTTIWLNLI